MGYLNAAVGNGGLPGRAEMSQDAFAVEAGIFNENCAADVAGEHDADEINTGAGGLETFRIEDGLFLLRIDGHAEERCDGRTARAAAVSTIVSRLPS